MSGNVRRPNVLTLREVLRDAERHRYAVGSFSPRYTVLVEPILLGAEECNSPAIVQISQKELNRYGVNPAQVAEEFYSKVEALDVRVPIVLHLDHTKTFDTIVAAIEAGFTSVMIDASEKLLEENISESRRVVEYAHRRGVSVEAELGMIGTTDFVETDRDEELFTKPDEAERLVRETGIDALAVSCGTAHGVYMVRRPRIDLPRLQAIRRLTSVHLVLHGGSGVPSDMMSGAIQLPGGGVSKVNIATDIELAFLGALGREDRMTDAEAWALPEAQIAKGREAVRATVVDKIQHFLLSSGKAETFQYPEAT